MTEQEYYATKQQLLELEAKIQEYQENQTDIILRDHSSYIQIGMDGLKMKHNTYKITFETGKTVYKKAFNREEAIILAQAEMILDGMDYKICSIVEI